MLNLQFAMNFLTLPISRFVVKLKEGIMRIGLSLLLFFIFLTDTGLSSTPSLYSLIKSALEHNLELKSERLSYLGEKARFNKAKKGVFKLDLSSEITTSRTKEYSWIKDEEGRYYKQEITKEKKPTIWLKGSLYYPHPLGGRLKVDLTGSPDPKKIEVSLSSEEPISIYQRKKLKDPLIDDKARLEVASLQLEDKINDVIYRVIDSFFGLQKINLTISLKSEKLKALEKDYIFARFKFEKGIIPEIDLLEIELRKVPLQVEIEQLKREREEKLTEFYNLIGRRIQGLEIEVSEKELQEGIERLKGRIKATELLSKIKDVPSVKIKHIEIESAKRRLKDTQSKDPPILIPSLTLSKEKDKEDFTIRLSLRVPLYDGGIKKEEVRMAQYELSKSEIGLRILLIELQARLKRLLNSIDDREKRMEIAHKNIDLAKRTYEIARIKYERGRISAKEFLDYKMRLFTEQKRFFEEQLDLYLDYIKLFKITGELYEVYKENII